MMRTLQKITNPIKRSLQLVVGRATILMTDDSPKLQTAQVLLLNDEIRDDVEVFQYYGLSSRPHNNAEAIVVSVGGNRDHGVVIAHGDRTSRVTGLANGEIALYDDLGRTIKLTRNGIVIDGGGADINISNAPNLNIAANVNITGSFAATGGTFTHADTDVGQDHMHQNVQPGTGDSGVPIGGGTGDYGGGVVGSGDGAAALIFWDSL